MIYTNKMSKADIKPFFEKLNAFKEKAMKNPDKYVDEKICTMSDSERDFFRDEYGLDRIRLNDYMMKPYIDCKDFFKSVEQNKLYNIYDGLYVIEHFSSYYNEWLKFRSIVKVFNERAGYGTYAIDEEDMGVSNNRLSKEQQETLKKYKGMFVNIVKEKDKDHIDTKSVWMLMSNYRVLNKVASNSDKISVVDGPAGSGKSTSTMKSYGKKPFTILTMANRIGQEDLDKYENALQNGFEGSLDTNRTTFAYIRTVTLNPNTKVKEQNKIIIHTEILVDEGSVLGVEEWDTIAELVKIGHHITILGDFRQLAPFTCKGSMYYSFINEFPDRVTKFETIYRNSNQQYNKDLILCFGDNNFHKVFTNEDACKFINTEQLHKAVGGCVDNKYDFLCITKSNKECDRYNFHAARCVLEISDDDMNSMIKEAKEGSYSYKLCEHLAKGDECTITYKKDATLRLMSKINDRKINVFNGSTIYWKGGEFFYDADCKNKIPYEFNASQFGIGYFITLFKSQGCEADYVILDILDKDEGYSTLRKNDIYVGLTRARKFTLVVGEPVLANKPLRIVYDVNNFKYAHYYKYLNDGWVRAQSEPYVKVDEIKRGV